MELLYLAMAIVIVVALVKKLMKFAGTVLGVFVILVILQYISTGNLPF